MRSIGRVPPAPTVAPGTLVQHRTHIVDPLERGMGIAPQRNRVHDDTSAAHPEQARAKDQGCDNQQEVSVCGQFPEQLCIGLILHQRRHG
jgi:hypothetical protein